ncbi:hypothetical protein H6802_00760 [Candidatus Nomurabacteria bacterium]|uniref:Uncharacterized protein n=1 Tax=candidate division WWE3 bacterium TaxID=2053526 RepID=A0A955E103_UNCKA|nr:hypothetical protein [candidate division WWE3 bacterium]MCB9823476.1 hypothetical protein [Candidatus Nomurabacteria bacterium]MCB9827758.1 hypothetical protein [Candidatus Nomurabacteria bacterium]HXK52363.1 hypothetical protein [bacterium]
MSIKEEITHGSEGRKRIEGEYFLPTASNRGLKDCGVFAAFFCAHNFRGIQYRPLNDMRAEIGKEKDLGTLPDKILKFLATQGLQCEYRTQVDWEEFLHFDSNKLEDVARELDGSDGVLVTASGLKECANSLVYEHSFSLWETDEDPEITFKLALTGGAFVICLVGANHYVVIVRQEDEAYVYYDPNDPSKLQESKKTDFFQWWEQTTGFVRLREAIIVKNTEE